MHVDRYARATGCRLIAVLLASPACCGARSSLASPMPMPRPPSSTCQALMTRLDGVTELAVDLEAHQYRSYLGFTCLMQVRA